MTTEGYKPRNLDEHQRLEAHKEKQDRLAGAKEALHEITGGRAVPSEHGRDFYDSAVARAYCANLNEPDRFLALAHLGLVYGETVIRHGLGETGWGEDDVRAIADSLHAKIIETARAVEPFEPDHATLDKDALFGLSASSAIAQHAAFRGMRAYVNSHDLKQIEKDLKKALETSDISNPLKGRDRLALGAAVALPTLGGFAAGVPNAGVGTFLLGGALGAAYKGGEILIDRSNETKAKSNADKLKTHQAELDRLTTLKAVRNNKPEKLERLTVNFSREFEDDMSRGETSGESLRNNLENRWKLLVGSVEQPEAVEGDADTKKKPRRLGPHMGKIATAALITAVSVTAGSWIGNKVGDAVFDRAPAVSGKGGSPTKLPTEVTIPETPTPETNVKAICEAIGAEAAPKDFPMDEAIVLPHPDDPAKRVVCAPPEK